MYLKIKPQSLRVEKRKSVSRISKYSTEKSTRLTPIVSSFRTNGIKCNSEICAPFQMFYFFFPSVESVIETVWNWVGTRRPQESPFGFGTRFNEDSLRLDITMF